ncbi:hypothetical protein FRC14_003019 [Serendipita sp. 396]|nr:hypothetical protein FRC14_003019 [Serendipita sp. 396]KAG8788516.1 hypothetical protein FRC15_003843 [Serendipita sp. 397]KAG8875013.1 hypothetical protein FRC20_004730 [Serendipita sp. 405]
MSYLPRFLQNRGANGYEMGSRGYAQLSNESLEETIHMRRKPAPSRCRRITAWAFLPTALFVILLIINSRKEIAHMSTAVKCKFAVQGLNFRHPLTNSSTTDDDEDDEDDDLYWARIVRPSELMDKLNSSHPPNSLLLHQSWKDEHLPEKFQKWSKQWRKLHGSDWGYVLWTDKDNRRLVEKFYPEYLKSYDSLPKEIYRADMARNMYMHRFGGIYADLDLVPLSPIPEHLPVLIRTDPPPIHIAYVGHMSGDEFEHSIPNAFMASVPAGHPFWLKPLHFIQQHQGSEKYNRQPEALTGPVALRTCVKQWEAERDRRHGDGKFDEVAILENGKIYPFSWWDSPFKDQCICRPQSVTFNAALCNSLYPHAWTITYWAHSWEKFTW